MSTVQLSKKSVDDANRQSLINWKVDEICTLLELYYQDQSTEHLVSAEYELRNLIDGLLNRHDFNDPPF